MSNFVNDTFTGSAGTLLSARAGETGATWTMHPGSTVSTTQLDGTGGARLTTATPSGPASIYTASGAPASADYAVSITVSLKSLRSDDQVFAAGRFSMSGALNGYIAGYGHGVGFAILKYVAGTLGVVGTVVAGTVADGDVLTLDMAGSTIRLLRNGTQIVSATDTSVASAGRAGVYLSASSAPGDAVGLHIAAVTAATSGASVFVACDGDSLTFGSYASTGANYPSRLATLLGATVSNLGRPGLRVDEFNVDAASRVDTTYVAGRDLDALIMLGGTNDANANPPASAATIKARLLAYWSARRTSTPARLLIACTIPHASPTSGLRGGDVTGYNAVIDDVNTWMRLSYKAFADRLIDVAAHPFLAAPTNARYFNADGVHLTDEGYAALAVAAYQAIAGVYTYATPPEASLTSDQAAKLALIAAEIVKVPRVGTTYRHTRQGVATADVTITEAT